MPKKDTNQHIACEHCVLDNICKPITVGEYSFDQINNILDRRQPLIAGEHLYKKGDSLSSIYALTSGTVKLIQNNRKGNEQVVGFRFAGELLGDEAISSKTHLLNAVAVDDISVCKIPMKGLDDIAKMIPDFQKNLIELLSHQCYTLHQQFASYAARNNSEERLAAFILNILNRSKNAHPLAHEIFLAMPRDDIANYLGLRRETLSRTLSKFQKMKIINRQNKTLKILNLDQLRLLAND